MHMIPKIKLEAGQTLETDNRREISRAMPSQISVQ